MRDDRYSGMRLPSHLPRLFQMSWRDADRRCPGRMLGQAIKVFDSLCRRELSPAMRSALRQHQLSPTLVDGCHMQSLVQVDRLGSEIAGLIEDNPGLSSCDALRMALLARSEYYAWEQKLCHDMENEDIPFSVSEHVKRALRDAASTIASSLFSADKASQARTSFSLDENLTQ